MRPILGPGSLCPWPVCLCAHVCVCCVCVLYLNVHMFASVCVHTHAYALVYVCVPVCMVWACVCVCVCVFLFIPECWSAVLNALEWQPRGSKHQVLAVVGDLSSCLLAEVQTCRVEAARQPATGRQPVTTESAEPVTFYPRTLSLGDWGREGTVWPWTRNPQNREGYSCRP